MQQVAGSDPKGDIMNPEESKPLELPPLEIEYLFYLEARCASKIPIGDVGGGELNISSEVYYNAYMLK